MKHIIVFASVLFETESLLELYEDERIVGCRYIPRKFTQQHIDKAIEAIYNPERVVPRYE